MFEMSIDEFEDLNEVLNRVNEMVGNILFDPENDSLYSAVDPVGEYRLNQDIIIFECL